MRCAALGEELLESGWRVVFAVSGETASMMAHLGLIGFEIVVLDVLEINEPKALLRIAPSAAALVIDHYELDRSYECTVRTWAEKIIVLDDNTGRLHDCDVLIDAAAPSSDIYARAVPAVSRVLIGANYALIRQNVLKRRAASIARRDGRRVEKILVSFGATDRVNATGAFIEAFASKYVDINFWVVLSSQAPHLETIAKRAPRNVGLFVDRSDIGELICDADLAVGAGGVSAFERAALGLPSVIVVTAENQRGILRILVGSGAAVDGGGFRGQFAAGICKEMSRLVRDQDARRMISERAVDLVDGRGAARIVEQLL